MTKKKKKKTIPVRYGFGWAKLSFKMEPLSKRLTKMSQRLLKFCHKRGCKDITECPELCYCGGVDLDLNTAVVWVAGKNLVRLVDEYCETNYWLEDWPYAISSKTNLEDAVYIADDCRGEAQYHADKFERTYHYLFNAGFIMGLHRSKYEKEYKLIIEARHIMYDAKSNFGSILETMKSALSRLEKLYYEEQKKEGDK